MSAKYISEGETIYVKNASGSTWTVGDLVDTGRSVGFVNDIKAGATTLATATYGANVVCCGIVEVDSAAVTWTDNQPVYGALGATVGATNVPTINKYFLGFAIGNAASPSTIKVRLAHYCEEPFRVLVASGTTLALTKADLQGKGCFLKCTSTSAIALAVPQATTCKGALIVKHAGSGTNAITITPATSTIAGSATSTALDAQNDVGAWYPDAVTDDWVQGPSTIA